jgi:hypothetical protein
VKAKGKSKGRGKNRAVPKARKLLRKDFKRFVQTMREDTPDVLETLTTEDIVRGFLDWELMAYKVGGMGAASKKE